MRGEQGQPFVYQSSDTGYNKHNNVVKSKSVQSAFWEHITKQRVGARVHFTIEYLRCCFPSPTLQIATILPMSQQHNSCDICYVDNFTAIWMGTDRVNLTLNVNYDGPLDSEIGSRPHWCDHVVLGLVWTCVIEIILASNGL